MFAPRILSTIFVSAMVVVLAAPGPLARAANPARKPLWVPWLRTNSATDDRGRTVAPIQPSGHAPLSGPRVDLKPGSQSEAAKTASPNRAAGASEKSFIPHMLKSLVLGREGRDATPADAVKEDKLKSLAGKDQPASVPRDQRNQYFDRHAIASTKTVTPAPPRSAAWRSQFVLTPSTTVSSSSNLERDFSPPPALKHTANNFPKYIDSSHLRSSDNPGARPGRTNFAGQKPERGARDKSFFPWSAKSVLQGREDKTSKSADVAARLNRSSEETTIAQQVAQREIAPYAERPDTSSPASPKSARSRQSNWLSPFVTSRSAAKRPSNSGTNPGRQSQPAVTSVAAESKQIDKEENRPYQAKSDGPLPAAGWPSSGGLPDSDTHRLASLEQRSADTRIAHASGHALNAQATTQTTKDAAPPMQQNVHRLPERDAIAQPAENPFTKKDSPTLAAKPPAEMTSQIARSATPLHAPPSAHATDRPRIIFRPAVAGTDNTGRAVLRPKVVVDHGQAVSPVLPSAFLPSLDRVAAQPIPGRVNGDTLPPPARLNGRNGIPQDAMPLQSPYQDEPLPPGYAIPYDEGYFPGEVDGFVADGPIGCGEACHDDGWAPFGHPLTLQGPHAGGHHGILGCLTGPPCYEGALGVERVMHAPFFIDTTQPLKNCRLRLDFAYDHEFPDRAEYFWAKMNLPAAVPPGGRGPADPVHPLAVERSVDYQDLRFYIERGTKQFSVGTEIPIRLVDPDIYHATSGMGDMNVVTKTVLLDGRRWQLAQTFRSYFPTGSPTKGVGTGHVSLEPGVAYRYKFSEITYFHGDLKYWFPLGGHPTHSGEVLQYGFGMSHVLHETDYFAIIPTLEFVGWSIFDGDQTPSIDGDLVTPGPQFVTESVDGMDILNFYPGIRFVWDNGNDCGVRECGISTGFALSEDHWYESILRVELRWSF